MDSKKRKRLEAAGWTLGNAEDFLGMSPEEASYLEVKLTLAREVESQRKKAGMSQSDLWPQHLAPASASAWVFVSSAAQIANAA